LSNTTLSGTTTISGASTLSGGVTLSSAMALPGSGIIASDGKLGIGTASPAYPLALSTTQAIQLGLSSPSAWVRYNPTSGGGDVWQAGANATGFHIYSETDGATRLIANGSGIVAVSALAAASGTSLCYNTAAISGYYSLSSCSSLREYKERISPLDLGLKTLLALQPMSYRWKNSGEEDLGFIAEDVEGVSPLLASYVDGKLDGVKYEHLTALIAKSFQDFAGAVDIADALTGAPTLSSAYSGAEVPAIYVDSVGNVGFGTRKPQSKLDVNGPLAANSALSVPADSRLQKNVTDIDDALAIVAGLRGIRFEWRSPEERSVGALLELPVSQSQVGLSADSVRTALPQAVSVSAADSIARIEETKIIPVLVEAVKALNEANEKQTAEIVELRTHLDELKRATVARQATEAGIIGHLAVAVGWR
jgi:hypothetical protein